MTLSPRRNTIRKPGASRPLRRRSSAHLVLVMAWLAFWLNTALFPCCEALAEALTEHADTPSQSATGERIPHQSNEVHAEHLNPDPSMPCEETVRSVAAIPDAYAQLTPTFDLELLAITGSVGIDVRAPDHSAIRAPRNYNPPPPFRIYQRTQRLLI